MASIVRQPFAPIDGARLQSLTSTKNRQNAISPPSSKLKRKATESAEVDDSENIDPVVFTKRNKSSDCFHAGKIVHKRQPKPSVVLKNALAAVHRRDERVSVLGVGSSRTILKPKAPSKKMVATPTGGRRAEQGFLRSNGLRASRIDSFPPKYVPTAPFSLDAALKGTLSSFAAASSTTSTSTSTSTSASASASAPASTSGPSLTPTALDLDQSGMQSSWFFDIHEDTPEQEMTNLLQHGTCVLDISSDEECEQKARRDRDEGRDKENIPPPNDVSQTSQARAARAAVATGATMDSMQVEKARDPLAQLNAEDYYAEGCGEESVVLVPGDEGDEEEGPTEKEAVAIQNLDVVIAVSSTKSPKDGRETVPSCGPDSADDNLDATATVEELMSGNMHKCSPMPATVLEPMEGTGESFELWESESSKGENASPVLLDTPVMPDSTQIV